LEFDFMRRRALAILSVVLTASLCGCGTPSSNTSGRPSRTAGDEAEARRNDFENSRKEERAAGHEKPEPPASPAANPAHDYPLRGKVVKVNRETGIVAIHHEEIPDFMPAMTMPFDLKGQEVLEDLQPGDKVRGTLRIRGVETNLVDVEITEMARPDEVEGMDRVRRQALTPGQAVPDFAMTTQEGAPLKLSDLKSKVVVLTFIYTRCPLPNFCPMMDQKFAKLADMLKTTSERATGVRLLSVSFDPEHDNPELLARHARLRGAKPPLWTFAVASHDELQKVAEPLGLTYGPTPNQIIHNLSTAVIGPDGKLLRLESGNDWAPADLLKTVVDAMPSTHAGR
jgi:protein SCO1/2